MEEIEFGDGTLLTSSAIIEKFVADQATSGDDDIITGYLNDTLYGGTGNDTLNGEFGSDTYLYASGDGDDVITDSSWSSSQNDRLVFTDLNAIDLSFGRNSDDDLVISILSGGSITVVDHFASSNTDMELFEFADGTIWTATDVSNEYVWL